MTSRIQYRSRIAKAYTLEEFQTAYSLPDDEALRIFQKFGPSIRELDTLMFAKMMRGNICLDDADIFSHSSCKDT